MKKILMASVSIAALTAIASPAAAGNFYISGGAGGAFSNDRDWEHEHEPPGPTSRFFAGEMDWDLGPGFEVAVGIDGILPGNGLGSLRVEIEKSFISLDANDANWHTISASSAGPPSDREGPWNITTWMLNVLVDFDIGKNVAPFVGVGVGGSWSVLDAASHEESGPSFVEISDAHDAGFAAQGIAGVSISIGSNWEGYAKYRAIWIDDMRATTFGNEAEGDIIFEDDLVHMFTAGIRYNFAPF